MDSNYSKEQQAAAIAGAEADGYVVVRKTPQTLLVDLDLCGLRAFEQRLKDSAQYLKVESWRYWESKTPGNYHVEVTLKEPIEGVKAVAAQLALGSDYKRELVSMRRLDANELDWCVLFAPKERIVIESKGLK